MKSTAIICTTCRRVLALGAELPAICLVAVPVADRRALSQAELDAHPAAHTSCATLDVVVPDDSEGEAALEAIARDYASAIDALVALVAAAGGSPPSG